MFDESLKRKRDRHPFLFYNWSKSSKICSMDIYRDKIWQFHFFIIIPFIECCRVIHYDFIYQFFGLFQFIITANSEILIFGYTILVIKFSKKDTWRETIPFTKGWSTNATRNYVVKTRKGIRIESFVSPRKINIENTNLEDQKGERKRFQFFSSSTDGKLACRLPPLGCTHLSSTKLRSLNK